MQTDLTCEGPLHARQAMVLALAAELHQPVQLTEAHALLFQPGEAQEGHLQRCQNAP